MYISHTPVWYLLRRTSQLLRGERLQLLADADERVHEVDLRLEPRRAAAALHRSTPADEVVQRADVARAPVVEGAPRREVAAGRRHEARRLRGGGAHRPLHRRGQGRVAACGGGGGGGGRGDT